MRMIDPTKVRFESKRDIVDYVTKGLPPSEQQLAQVLSAMENPVSIDAEGKNEGQDVIITSNVTDGWNEEMSQEIASVLRFVHENRVRNRNAAIATGAAVAIATLIGGIKIGGAVADHRYQKECNEDD